MPDRIDPDVGIGELSRQVRDVLIRFEGLATRLETQFVRSEHLELYKQLVNQTLKTLQDAVSKLASAENVRALKDDVDAKADNTRVSILEDKVKELEDDKKWLSRLILGFIVMGVLGAVFAFSQIGGGA